MDLLYNGPMKNIAKGLIVVAVVALAFAIYLTFPANPRADTTQFRPQVCPPRCGAPVAVSITGPCPLGMVCKDELTPISTCQWPNTCG